MKAELLYKCENITGEAATWLSGREQLLWVDIEGKMLFEYSPDTCAVKRHYFGKMVTTIIPLEGEENSVILALQDELVVYNLETGSLNPVLRIPGVGKDFRTNDGKASPDGRMWLGVMHLTNHDETGFLYSINRSLRVYGIMDKQCIPNGIVWNASGTVMYYADSGKGCIMRYDYDRMSGRISSPSVVVEVPAGYGVPDGMAIDSHGMLWVAHWGGYGVYVWNPENGCLIDKVEVPAPHVASCTFGGVNLQTLYITTARAGLSANQLNEFCLSGSIFAVDTKTTGGKSFKLRIEN